MLLIASHSSRTLVRCAKCSYSQDAADAAIRAREDAALAKKQAKLDRGQGKKKKGGLARMKKGGSMLEAEAATGGGGGGDDDDDDDDDDNDDGAAGSSKKSQRKAEHREQVEARAAQVEAMREKESEKDAKRRSKEAEREAKALAREEKARQEAEALAKAKQEEYDKWKDMFSVDEAGEEAESAVEEEGMLERFITYMKEHKVTVLEEIAAEFKLRVQDVIQRVQALERMGHVTGVIDDRGKFIYITTAEMEAVAKYVQRKGRVRISTLAMESNKLIDLQPKRKEISTAEDDDSEKPGGAAAAPAG